MKARDLLDRVLANWPAKVISITAAILLLVFNRMNNVQERALEIPLELILPAGYSVAAPFQGRVSLTVKGENEEAIGSIRAEDFRVYVDLSGVTEEGPVEAPVRYTRKGPALRAGTYVEQVEPMEVTIFLEEKVRKELAVEPDLRGSPARGYTLSRYSIDPETVEIVGPRSRIEAVSAIVTEEIDISGKSNDFAVEKSITLSDPLVTVVGSRTVEFQAVIKEIVVTRLYTDVPVDGLALDPMLTWKGEKPKGSIGVVGPQLVIEGLSSRDVGLSVDLSGFSAPGEYRVAVGPRVPPRLQIRSYAPREITVVLEPRIPTEEPL